MRRVKRGINARIRRQKILSLRKGAVGSNSRLFRIAKQQVIKSINFSYCGRKERKREFRSLWIIRLNSAIKHRSDQQSVNLIRDYNSFIYRIRKKKCLLNRKVITQLALIDRPFFEHMLNWCTIEVKDKRVWDIDDVTVITFPDYLTFKLLIFQNLLCLVSLILIIINMNENYPLVLLLITKMLICFENISLLQEKLYLDVIQG